MERGAKREEEEEEEKRGGVTNAVNRRTGTAGVCPGGNEARQGDDGRLRINLTSDSWRLQERL